MDCTNEFVVDATALPANEEANLECFIEDPNGQPIEVFVNKIQGPNSIGYDRLQIDNTPQTVVHKKGSEFPQKFLIYQLGGGYEMINLM